MAPLTMQTKQQPTAAIDHPASKAPDEHYGDLRKGAYLRRRADYQMQATSPYSAQARTPLHGNHKAR